MFNQQKCERRRSKILKINGIPRPKRFCTKVKFYFILFFTCFGHRWRIFHGDRISFRKLREFQGYTDDPNRNIYIHTHIYIYIYIKTFVQECNILYLCPSIKFPLGLNRTGEAEGKIYIHHFKTALNIVSPTTITEGMNSDLKRPQLGQVGRMYSLLGVVFLFTQPY